MMSRTFKPWMGTAILLAALSACGSENEPPDGEGLVVAKAAASGDAQTAPVGSALGNPLAVVVTRDGVPEQGVTVTWSVQSGGGTLAAATSTTNAQGLATMTWTLGQSLGGQAARASVAGASGSPIGFTATATAAGGAAANIELFGGNGQTGPVNAALANPLTVRVTDALGNGVAGATVAWAVISGGGTVSAPTSVSGANGNAAIAWTLGPTVGPQSVEASATGLAGSPITFTATGAAAPAPGSGVTVGNDFFDPTTLTVDAGATVVWTWVGTGAVSHSVQSVGDPSFASSAILTGSGQTYSVTFNTPGSYDYQCAVHGAAMSGTIVVE